MSLIDSDMFYWRQKKCFSMIDKVKNVTTLIIYSSAWEEKKLQSQKPFTSFIRCNRIGEKKRREVKKKKERKKVLSDSPVLLMGQSARFQFSLTKLCYLCR